MIILNTHLRSDTYDELVRAFDDADIGHLLTGLYQQATVLLPSGTETMHLPGEIARTLYRLPNGTVFAWVDAYEGEEEVFQLTSQRAWDLNLARGMSVLS